MTQITDHFPQFFILKNTQISHDKSGSLKNDYSKFNENEFHEEFNQLDLTYLENSDMDVDSKFERFLIDF